MMHRSMSAARPILLTLLLTSALLLAAGTSGAAPSFYDDDPLWEAPETQDASGIEHRSIDAFYDMMENTFAHPGERGQIRALNVNTVDEVPNSSWFVNRIGTLPLTPEDIARGPTTSSGPAAGKWTLIRGKTDGITPGMTIVDSAGDTYFIKFDPPGHSELATGAEVVATKLFWAFGYQVAETYIAHVRPENLVIGESAMKTYLDGRKRPFTQRDVDMIFRMAAAEPDGSYRVLASKALPGEALGGFRYFGTRPDDPNDIVPHEHHRELRGLRAVAAWLNHVDTKSINSMDTLVSVGNRKTVRHHLLDFGSTLGSGATTAHSAWEGHEYIYEHRDLVDTMTFGLNVPVWATAKSSGFRSIGHFEAEKFDPANWKPRYPNAAFQRARPDDLFWAARRIMAFSDNMLRAAARTGQYSDPEAERYLAEMLIKRRDKVVGAFLPAVNPLVKLKLDEFGVLTFENAAVSAGVAQRPEGYRAVWHDFDNTSGATRPIGSETSNGNERMGPPHGLPTTDGSFIRVDLSAINPPHPSWEKPIHATFRRCSGSWKLVGLDRMPEEGGTEE